MTDTNNEWIERFYDLVLSTTPNLWLTKKWFIEQCLRFLPKSISREAVEKLREKRWNGKHKPVTTENGWELVWEINNDLDQLLSPTNPQNDTEKI